jgi:hypothetical protein
MSKNQPPKKPAPAREKFEKGYNPPQYEDQRPKAPPKPPPTKDS